MPCPVTLDTANTGAARRPLRHRRALEPCVLGAFGRHRVDLGERDRAARQLQKLEDLQVLACLRHGAIVGRNDQEHEVDPSRAREHVVHQSLVTGHVHEAQHAAIRHWRVGIPEIERDPARFLFRQAVGIDPGERLHQRGLAMVDVAGGADDHAALFAPPLGAGELGWGCGSSTDDDDGAGASRSEPSS
jgi:hypothetical protein